MTTRKSDLCIYFDSCIYIAHYRQETASYGKARIDAITQAWQENDRGGSIIATSSITICEVIATLLQYNLKTEVEDFKNRFKFGTHKLFDVDPIVSEKAAEYRQFYRANPLKRPNREKPFTNLVTPDAIHLATAKLYDCDEFWTLDGLNETKDKYESIKPLWLNNKVGGDALIITAPALPQGTLPLA
jgi:predicted nucleic acid-binding protein